MSTEGLEKKRWLIAIAGVVIQLCLGTVYAWSVFRNPLMAAHGWAQPAVQLTFTIIMAVIATSAAFGGMLVDKKGPRFVATIGGILFGLGVLIAGLADQIGSLPLMYVGFGVVAGLGNGFGYVTPIATLVRWFPDKRGLVSGLAVMGFGLGAFFMGQIAPGMINSYKIVEGTEIVQSGVSTTFYIWGAIFLVLVTGSAQLFKNPPKGWTPAGWTPKASASAVSASDHRTLAEAIRMPQWWMLWSILGLNVAAGLGLLSQLSPMAQDLLRPADFDANDQAAVAALAVAGGSVLAIASIFNGLGRLFWAWTSDFAGRKVVFLIMLGTEAALYLYLPQVANATLFTVIACYLLACYGGGFATMPAFATDSFGASNIGRVYGVMLTAWGVAGVVGPMVFATLSRQTALYTAAGLLIAGFVIALLFKRPAPKSGSKKEASKEPAKA